jgi:hypothetical protein
MLRASGVLVTAVLLTSGVAKAGNSEDVVAGNDVALTGGAVVANVHTGGAMWFNPAGVARLDSRSVDLTGAVLSYSIVSAPGTLSIESGEQSEGSYSPMGDGLLLFSGARSIHSRFGDHGGRLRPALGVLRNHR